MRMPRLRRTTEPNYADSLVRWLRHRRAGLLVAALAGLPLAGAGWIVVTGLLAHDELLASQ